MTASDVDVVMSLDWAEIPEKEMVSSQRGGRLDASFIAEFQGRLVGFVLARIVYSGRPMKGSGTIHQIVVRPDYQHRGIGTLLLDRLLEHCKAEGIPSIRAFPHRDDVASRKYFEEVGFKPSDIIIYEKSCE
jgi:GNAT superfamily N-acetyltransferase